MNMQQQLTSLRELFMLFEDPKDKFVQLMDMAKESEHLKENEKIEKNKINGCTSRAVSYTHLTLPTNREV